VDLLPRVLDAASRFAGPPDETELATMVRRTRAETLFV
jgi:hypothetical protein